jgi:hypothetical protein
MSDDSDGGTGDAPKRDGRWRAGQESPNPFGRKGKPKNPKSVISTAVEERVIVTQNGRRKKLSKLEAAAVQLANQAAQGDLKAIKQIRDWLREDEARKPDEMWAGGAANYALVEDDLKTIANAVERIKAAGSSDDGRSDS